MTMKKTLWFALLLLLVCVFAFSACDSGDTPPTNNENNQQATDNNNQNTGSGESQTNGNGNDNSNTPMECQHAFGSWNTVKQATCKEEGKLVRTCSKCSETEESTVSKTNVHTEVVDAAISATCTVDGKTEGKHCSVCGKTIVAQTVVKASGHNEVVDATIPSTCFQPGLTQGKHCSNCYEVIVAQRELPILLHEYENGFCKNCSAYDEIAKSQELLNEALRHEYAVTSIIDGHNWLVELNQGRIAELKSQYGISYVYDDATCYSKISEINSQISDLNYQISSLEMYNDPADRSKLASLKQQKSSLENQKAKYEAMRSINDYENRILSYNDDYERDISNENDLYEQNKINIELKYARDEKICASHQWGDWKIELTVSCQNIGLKTRYCNVCKLVENDVAEKFEHSIVFEEYIPATCTESGMTEGHYCSTCNTVLVNKETIAPIGHSYGDWTLIREPSCALDGLSTATCQNCGLVQKEFALHLEHVYSQDNICTSCNMIKPSEGLVYKLNPDNESYKLSSDGTCTDETIVIAKYYLGKLVTDIGTDAFYYNKHVKTVIIPDSIKTIDSSFYGCSSLSSVVLPEGLETIGKWAFYECTSLTNITIPSTVISIGKSAFLDCSNLTTVNILNGITTIGEYAFYNCTSLQQVYIPDSVTKIETYAFRNCSALVSINIPKTVSQIDSGAFAGCSSLNIIYYGGTELDWENVYVSYNNSPLTNSICYYFSETRPIENGNYWHYVDGLPTIWE